MATYLITTLVGEGVPHEAFLENLQAYATNRGATLKLLFQGKCAQQSLEALGLAYLTNREHLAKDLHLCADVPLTPTALNPLSGLETFTQGASAIFGHGQTALVSVATHKASPAKFLYTTGALNDPVYPTTKAGARATFHHCLGALIVEVDATGDWFVRQILADADGSFYDLGRYVSKGKVKKARSVEALVFGDIHVAKMEDSAKTYLHSLLSRLRPKHLVLHDLFDHEARSHHAGALERLGRYQQKVQDEVILTAGFLREFHHPWCQQLVVSSNHNSHLDRWALESDFRNDPPNARYLLECQLYLVKRAQGQPGLLEWALRQEGCPKRTRFLAPDESYELHGVELGQHGDKGAGGSRGSLSQFSRSGAKSIIGHSHTAGIRFGAYQVGVSATLDMDYVTGLSSWSHSHCILYVNGKRTIITEKNNKWKNKG